jgi:hypothetical protein
MDIYDGWDGRKVPLRNSLRKVFGDRNLVKGRRRTYQGNAWHHFSINGILTEDTHSSGVVGLKSGDRLCYELWLRILSLFVSFVFLDKE